MTAAIVLAFDHLPHRLLGCYGNLCSPTPNLDRFAAASAVFDWHFAENLDPTATSHAWWSGRYEFPRIPTHSSDETPLLVAVLQSAGVELLSLRERGRPPAGRFPIPADQTEEVQAVPASTALFAAAADIIDGWQATMEPRRLLWINPVGIASPPSPRVASPSPRVASRGSESLAELPPNPTSHLDASLAGLLQTLREFSANHETLTIITAAEGPAVGNSNDGPEPSRQRSDAAENPFERLQEERVHTPLIIHQPGRDWGVRIGALVQPVDLLPTLLDWFDAPLPQRPIDGFSLLPLLRDENRQPEEREFAVMGDDQRGYGIRSRDFLLLAAPEALSVEVDEVASAIASGALCLHVKPDDIWDVHNVAPQEPEETERLRKTLREFLQQRATAE